MRGAMVAWALVAALVAPAALWAGEEPPAPPGPATQTTATTPQTARAQPPATTTPATTAPAAPPPATTTPAPATTPADPPPDRPRTASTRQPRARAAASTSVTIEDFRFRPATVTVDAGDTIAWTNRDTAPHNAVADDGTFETRNLSRGQSDSVTLNEPGTHAYICTIHPSMRGTVVVRDAGGGDSGGGDSADDGSADSGSTAGDGSSGSGDAAAGDSAGTSSTGRSLANTGLDALAVALTGFALLGLGAALRRRLT